MGTRRRSVINPLLLVAGPSVELTERGGPRAPGAHAASAAREGDAEAGLASAEAAEAGQAPPADSEAFPKAPPPPVLDDGRDFDIDDNDVETEWEPPSEERAQRFLDAHHPRVVHGGMVVPPPLCIPTGRHCCTCCSWIDPCCEKNHGQLAHLGIGINNYFKWLKLMGWSAFFMGLFTLPMLLINIGNSAREGGLAATVVVSRTMLSNLGPIVNGTNAFPIAEMLPYWPESQALEQFEVLSREQVAVLYTVCDLLACGIFVMATCLLGMGEEDDVEHVVERCVTVDQYSIRIKKVARATTAAQLKDLMQEVTGHLVAEVAIAYDNNKSTSMLLRRGKLLLKRDRHTQRVLLLRSRMSKTSSGNDGLAKKIEKLCDKAQQITIKLERLYARWISKRETGNRAVAAFVTFETVAGRDCALEEYRTGFWPYVCQSRTKRLNGRRIRVSPAPLPSAVMWENLGSSRCNRYTRRGITFLISALLLALTGAVMYVVRERQSEAVAIIAANELAQSCDNLSVNATLPEECSCRALSYSEMLLEPKCYEVLLSSVLTMGVAGMIAALVVALNALFGQLMERMSEFQRHMVKDKQAVAAFLGLLVRQFCATAVVVVFINSDVGAIFRALGINDPTANLQLGKDPLWQVGVGWYNTVGVPLLFSVGLSVVSTILMAMYKACRARCRRCGRSKVVTQDQLHKMLLGDRFKLERRLARLTNTAFVAFTFSAGIPLMHWVAAIAFFVVYWLDKYVLLRRSRKPPQYNATLGRSVRSVLPYALLLHLVMACVMLGNPDILATGGLQLPPADSYLGGVFAILDRFLRWHTLPLLVCFSVVLGYLLMGYVCNILSAVVTVATCALCRHTGHAVEGQATALPFSYVRDSHRLHGQASYHFHRSPWYKSRLRLSEEQQLALEGGVANLPFTELEFVDEQSAPEARLSQVTATARASLRESRARVSGASAGAGGGAGAGAETGAGVVAHGPASPTGATGSQVRLTAGRGKGPTRV